MQPLQLHIQGVGNGNKKKICVWFKIAFSLCMFVLIDLNNCFTVKLFIDPKDVFILFKNTFFFHFLGEWRMRCASIFRPLWYPFRSLKIAKGKTTLPPFPILPNLVFKCFMPNLHFTMFCNPTFDINLSLYESNRKSIFVSVCLCVCMYRRILLTTKPIWFSFTESEWIWVLE